MLLLFWLIKNYNATQSEKVDDTGLCKLILKDLSPEEVRKDMVATLGWGPSPSSTVKKWDDEFKRGRESLEDDPRPGWLGTVTTQGTIDKLHDMILTDRQITQQHAATELTSSQTSLMFAPFSLLV